MGLWVHACVCFVHYVVVQQLPFNNAPDGRLCIRAKLMNDTSFTKVSVPIFSIFPLIAIN